MSLITHCICDWRMERGCPVHGGGQPSLASLEHLLGLILEKLEKITMSQSDIDAAVSTDTALLNDLATQTAAIGAAQTAFAAEIATLQAAGVDTSGLDAVNAQLAAAQAPLDAAVAAISAASAPPAAPAAPAAPAS